MRENKEKRPPVQVSRVEKRAKPLRAYYGRNMATGADTNEQIYKLRNHPTYAVTAAMIALKEMEKKLFATPSIQHIYDANGNIMTMDAILRGQEKELLSKIMSMASGRLAQANIHGVSATNTIEFVCQ